MGSEEKKESGWHLGCYESTPICYYICMLSVVNKNKAIKSAILIAQYPQSQEPVWSRHTPCSNVLWGLFCGACWESGRPDPPRGPLGQNGMGVESVDAAAISHGQATTAAASAAGTLSQP